MFVAELGVFADGGSISGNVKYRTGGVIPAAKIELVNTALNTEFQATTDAQEYDSFPALPVGRYDLAITAPGFQPQKKSDIAVDADAALTFNRRSMSLAKSSP